MVKSFCHEISKTITKIELKKLEWAETLWTKKNKEV